MKEMAILSIKQTRKSYHNNQVDMLSKSHHFSLAFNNGEEKDVRLLNILIKWHLKVN